jgi:maleate isomerase
MRLAFSTDGGAAYGAALGVIVLQVDETLETEMRGVFAEPGVALYHSRIPSDAEVTPETLARMEADLPRAAAMLPPGADFDVIGYACTSGATVIGPDTVAGLIRSVHPGASVTNPLTAVMAACDALGVRKLAFVTPYVASVSRAMREVLENDGLTIGSFGSFEQAEEQIVARISPASVLDAVVAVGSEGDADAVFLSCTNLRSFEIIEEAEARVGKPVISSNLALCWHMRRLAGLSVDGKGPGRLFRDVQM